MPCDRTREQIEYYCLVSSARSPCGGLTDIGGSMGGWTAQRTNGRKEGRKEGRRVGRKNENSTVVSTAPLGALELRTLKSVGSRSLS